MSKAILRDNDQKFLELIIREVRKVEGIINIRSIIHTHRIDVQVQEKFKDEIFNVIKNLHAQFGLVFKASEFIKDKNTLISFQLTDL